MDSKLKRSNLRVALIGVILLYDSLEYLQTTTSVSHIWEHSSTLDQISCRKEESYSSKIYLQRSALTVAGDILENNIAQIVDSKDAHHLIHNMYWLEILLKWKYASSSINLRRIKLLSSFTSRNIPSLKLLRASIFQLLVSLKFVRTKR